MAEEEIRQRMILDASQVLQTLDLLDKGFGRLGTRLADTSKVVDQFGRTSPIEKQIRAVDSLAVSYGTFSRVMETQVIVRALNKIQNAMESGAKAAIEYQTRLAEIGTISKGAGIGGTEQFGDDIRKLSDRYNLDLLDATSGLYETVSNHIAQPMQFMRTAAEFSKGSITSMADSVRLLSGTLNAYGLQTSQADKIASQFNRTIELGAVTGTELANAFGRVAPRAQQLGVSIEELQAWFATLTIRGLKANEAATQISGVLSALVKPSEAMRAKLDEMGFPTSKLAVATLGLGGVMKALSDSVNGNAEAMGEMLPNIRGLAGAASVGSQASELYAKNLTSIQNTATSLNQSRAMEILSSDAQTVSKAFNEFSNAITADIGQQVLSLGRGVIELGGGVETLTKNLPALTPLLGVATAGMAAYAAAAWSGATANAAFKSSLLGGIGGALLVGEALAGGKLIGNAAEQLTSAPALDAWEKQAQKALKATADLEKAKADVIKKEEDDMVAAVLARGQQLNREYIGNLQTLGRSNADFADQTARAANRIVKSYDDIANATRRAAEEAKDFQADSAQRVESLKGQKDDIEFGERLAKSGNPEKEKKRRAEDLARQAQTKLLHATNRDEVADAVALFQKAGSTTDDPRVKQSILDQQIQAERAFQANQAARKPELDALAERQTIEADKKRSAAEALKASLSVVGKTPEQLAEQKKQRDEALKTLGDTKLTFSVNEGIANLQKQIQTAFDNFKIKLGVDVTGLEKYTGQTYSTPDELLQGVTAAQAKAAKELDEAATIAPNAQRDRQLQAEIAGILGVRRMGHRQVARDFGLNSREVNDLSEQLAQSIEKQIASGKINPDLLKSDYSKLGALKNASISGNIATNVGGAFDVQDFSLTLGKMQELAVLRVSQKEAALQTTAPRVLNPTNNNTPISINLGGITVNGASDPKATAKEVMQIIDKNMGDIMQNIQRRQRMGIGSVNP